jgi:ribosomal protein S18 acetylase RimI-like enzyme
MSTEVSLRPASELPPSADLVSTVWALIHEAGNPYYDWLYGSPETAHAALGDQIQLPSSEVWLGRVLLLLTNGRVAGLFVALGGDELARCRTADALAALRAVGRSGAARSALVARIEESRALFDPPGPDEFYLSKIGVVRDRRATGLGRALLHHYLATGYAAGFRRFRVDVSPDNLRAVELYRSVGFDTLNVREAGGIRYMSMALASGRSRGDV